MRVITNNDGTCGCKETCPNTVKGKPGKKCLAYGTHGANLLVVKNVKDIEEKMERNGATKNKKRKM